MIINTRKDLDSLQGTQEYTGFINYLKGSTITTRDIQVYSENYELGTLDPIWVEVEDLTTITNFGFTKDEIWSLT